MLSRWLQRQHGSTVQGPLVSLSRGGLLRVSDVQSRPVRVELPVVHGGQAAVARAVDQTGTSLALRVQAVASDAEKARQMERLVNMTTVAAAARDQPDRFPAVLPVLESFVLVVPGSEVPVTVPEPEYELWCDLMAWCPHDLNGWAQAVPVGTRQPAEVLGAFVPVLATVHAVHQDLGVVHRDITPNNVLVDDAGRLLLADWGIAHGLASGQTSTYTQLVGNRGFSLPPEMLAGDPSVGRYTDAWYLGSLLAWMLTGAPPGPQHGPQWLPPGMPGGPVGDQVAAVVRGLCWPDPRGRMDLGQVLAVLSDAAAGRVSTHLTGPAGPGLGAAVPGLAPGAAAPAAPGVTVPDPALGPTARFTGSQTDPYGAPPPYGYAVQTSPYTNPGTPSDAPASGLDDRRSPSRTWLRVVVAAVAVVIVAAAAWGASRVLGGGGTPEASSGSGRTAPSTGPSRSVAADPDTSAGTGHGGPAADTSATGPTYSQARIQPILDSLYEATGGTQFTSINFYPDYVIATAPTKPGAATFDFFIWRDGKITTSAATIQPEAEDLFDATTVDWSQAEVLAGRMPELTGVDHPDETYVFVSRELISRVVQFQVSTSDDYYSPWIRADAGGNVTEMGGGMPGTPAEG